eukprot:7812282-Pyramimonas_sp.AAC.1
MMLDQEAMAARTIKVYKTLLRETRDRMAKAAGVKDESSEDDRCEDRARGRAPHPAARRTREAAAAPDTPASARHETRRPGGKGGEEQSPG